MRHVRAIIFVAPHSGKREVVQVLRCWQCDDTVSRTPQRAFVHTTSKGSPSVALRSLAVAPSSWFGLPTRWESRMPYLAAVNALIVETGRHMTGLVTTPDDLL